MDVLPLNFKILRYCGIWYDSYKKYQIVKLIYRTFVVVLIFNFTSSALVEMTLVRNNLNELTECLFMSLTYLTLCFKLINFLCRPKSMNKIINLFRVDVFQPRTSDERTVLLNYRSTISIIIMGYIALVQFTAVIFGIIPLIKMKNENLMDLPYRSYQPYDMENVIYYWITYLSQVICAIIGIFINIALDTLLCGFILLICGQIDLCCNRLIYHTNGDSKFIKECVMHHVLIRDAVKKVQSFFIGSIVPFFIFSLFTICTSIYQIPQNKTGSVEFFCLIMYLVCLLCQVFFYCWFGNELKLKCKSISDAVYESDWTMLQPAERKNFLFIMLLSQREMTISYHGLFNISIQTYVWILKTSYGAFNILQTVS